MENFILRVKQNVISNMDVSREMSDEEIRDLIEEAVKELGDDRISIGIMREVEQKVFDELRGMDVIQELIDDKSISEIMVNGPDNIFYEKEGKIFKCQKGFVNKEKLEDTIQTIVSASNKIVNEASPIVDTRLMDGSRVNIVLSPIALDGSAITIRKFPDKPIGMDGLISIGSISREIADELKLFVEAGFNIFVSGGTGSGKTTFLNALSEYIPETERVITIEDSAELKLTGIPNLIRLETRLANLENVAEISIRSLIKSALRMRPDRVIVGECRGAEALDMLQAMNTGHDGSLSTGHANSCRDMIARLETMVFMGMDLPISAIRSQIASGIDLLVHLGRLRDRSRKLLDVAEIEGMKDGEVVLNPLYHFEETGEKNGRVEGEWKRIGVLKNRNKLINAGTEELYERLSQV